MWRIRSSIVRVALVVGAIAVGPARAGPILWIDDYYGNIGTVDVQTGSVHVIGNSGENLTDIAFDPSGNLWGISWTGIFRISQTTGVATLVGQHSIAAGNALVFGTNGTLYAAGGYTNQLFTVNTATGQSTPIGDMGSNIFSAGDLAFNPTDGGSLYLTDTNSQLVRINLGSSFSATEIGPLGFNNVYGLATGDDGVLYGAAQTQLFSVNTSTGGGTLRVNYAGHGLDDANGTAFVHEAPEPASLTLLALGSLIGLRSRRGRYRWHRAATERGRQLLCSTG